MFSAVIFSFIGLTAVGIVTVAFRERARVAAELRAVLIGLDERTADVAEDAGVRSTSSGRELTQLPSELSQLLDEAMQPEDHRLAVLSINELQGRAALAKSRALLLSRGLSRIALLSGGGGAFVIIAAGNFERASILLGGGAVALGLVASMTSHGFMVSARKLAKRYSETTYALARLTARRQPSPAED